MGSNSWKTSSLIFFLNICGFCASLHIERLLVPSIIEANVTDVILDCDYTLEEWDKNRGFVLAWYLNRVNLVYQWIPPREPQVVGILKDKIDLSFTSSDDPYERHRALKVLRPDPGLSGTYSCRVSTFEEEDSDSASLLVWTAPAEVELRIWRPSLHLVNITCVAYDVSPKPEFKLYLKESRRRKRIPIKIKGRSDIMGSSPGLYMSESWGLTLYSNTSEESTIGCTVLTKEKLFRETKEKIYHSDLPVITTTTSTSTTTQLPEEEAIRSPSIAASSAAPVFINPSIRNIGKFLRLHLINLNGWRGIGLVVMYILYVG
ncbi:UNVERIFIED_CONTAM: hypothetical protein RMT77_003508 [Armadillidium vulgare]